MIILHPQDGPIKEAGDDKGNPYHDRSGRFSTKGGAGATPAASGSRSSSADAGSLTSAQSVARISRALANMPEGTQLVIGPDAFRTSGDSWASLTTGEDLTHDEMAAGKIPLLVSRGLLPGVMALTPNVHAQLSEGLVEAVQKSALGVPGVIYSLAAFSDLATTGWALSHPTSHESNPLAAWAGSPAKIVAFGSVTDAVTIYAWTKLMKNHPKIQKGGFLVGAVVRGFAAYHNIKVNRTSVTGIPNP